MSSFDSPIFIKSTYRNDDVIVFGKAPELEVADTADGVARFGGQWRSPSYLRAYIHAAEVLVEHAVRTKTLDDIALPAFYLQRHALELLVKRLLSWVYEYAKACADSWVSSNFDAKDFKIHDIPKLLDYLTRLCQHFKFALPPADLLSLVQEFSSFEESDTWARYETSRKNGVTVHHIQEEVVLPLVQLQKKLETVTWTILHRFDGTDAYEDELYYACFAATQQDT